MESKQLICVFIVLGAIVTLSEAIDPDTLQRCCDTGTQIADQGRPCEYIAVSHIVSFTSFADTKTCRDLAGVCCQESLSSKHCSEGKSSALEQGTCPESSSQDDKCDQDRKECCNCCLLGINTFDENPSMECDATRFGEPCDTAFRECCEDSRLKAVQGVTEVTQGDMNTCERFPGLICSQICINTPGSYRCACNANYVLAADRRSCNIDLSGNPCAIMGCEQDCEVLSGYGVRCSCNNGYQLNSDQASCDDINECENNPSPCDRYQCENTEGSFKCHTCLPGYQFDESSRECLDVNECAIGNYVCLSGQSCVNTEGAYQCQRRIDCGTGYTLDGPSQQCVDIDECESGTHNCPPNYSCDNQMGTFRCNAVVTCPNGYSAESDGTCRDVDECLGNVCPAQTTCANYPGSYSCRAILNCLDGFESDPSGLTCIDIDECSRRTHNCPSSQQCENTRGSFICNCPPGYNFDEATASCQDKDECREFGRRCSHNCENTIGSYRCSCRSGFELSPDGFNCRDVNECEVPPGPCEQRCFNSYGSYQCFCDRGYTAIQNGLCQDIDECSGQLSYCQGICTNTLGSYRCSCPVGYDLLSDKRTCKDINECQNDVNICGLEQTCFNTRGGYRCYSIQCPEYFEKASSTLSDDPNVDAFRCVKVACDQISDIIERVECLMDPTNEVSYSYISIPASLPPLTKIITMRTIPRSSAQLAYWSPDLVHFRIVDGNAGGWFQCDQKFTSREVSCTIEVARNFEGPFDTVLRLEMDVMAQGSLLVRQRNVALIHIFVSQYGTEVIFAPV